MNWKKFFKLTKKKRDAMILLLICVEFYIILLTPTFECLGELCTPNYLIGIYYMVYSIFHVLVLLFITYSIFSLFAIKKLERFYEITKIKLILYFTFYLVLVVIFETLLLRWQFIGIVGRLVNLAKPELIIIPFLHPSFVNLVISVIVISPILLYFIACILLFKRK